MKRLVSMAPGFIFGYSDDDQLFMQDWLSPQVRILASYPNVGVVTGMPTHVCFGWGVKSNKRFALREDVTVQLGGWPDEWIEDYIRSVGRNQFTLESYMKRFGALTPGLLEYNGVKAWGTSHHGQFLGYRETLQPFIAAHEEYHLCMSKSIEWLDTPIDDAGYLRLATEDLLVRHIGNVMDDTIEELAEGVERWW